MKIWIGVPIIISDLPKLQCVLEVLKLWFFLSCHVIQHEDPEGKVLQEEEEPIKEEWAG